jgi:hypothetical protein
VCLHLRTETDYALMSMHPKHKHKSKAFHHDHPARSAYARFATAESVRASVGALAKEKVPVEVQQVWEQRRTVNWTKQRKQGGYHTGNGGQSGKSVRWAECRLFIATGEDRPEERALFAQSFKQVLSKFDFEKMEAVDMLTKRAPTRDVLMRGATEGAPMRGAADALLDFEVCRRADLHVGTCGSLWDRHLHHLRHVDGGGESQSFMYNRLLGQDGVVGGEREGGAQDTGSSPLPLRFCGPAPHQQQIGLPECDSPCALTG